METQIFFIIFFNEQWNRAHLLSAFLPQNIWDSVWSWQKMKLVSEGKNHIALKSRKPGLFYIFVVVVWAIYFPTMKKASRKKIFSIFWFQGLTDILSFHFLLTDKRNWKDCVRCQVSFFRAQLPGSLNSLVLEKCLYGVPVFSGGVLCSEQTEKASLFLFKT